MLVIVYGAILTTMCLPNGSKMLKHLVEAFTARVDKMSIFLLGFISEDNVDKHICR